MTSSTTGPTAERPFPPFFTEWREAFGDSAAEFTPLDYLNQEQAPPFVLAAQWLFCPVFTEYRDCVVVVKNGTEEGELTELEKSMIDDWCAFYQNDPPKVEFKANLLHISGLFASVDLTPYEADLAVLAHTVARCWEALLKAQFPERQFAVEVFDDPDSAEGPQLTFSTIAP